MIVQSFGQSPAWAIKRPVEISGLYNPIVENGQPFMTAAEWQHSFQHRDGKICGR
jgi:hypothetical protein